MSTEQQSTGTELSKSAEKELTYRPLGEDSDVTLTISTVRKFLTKPTRSGAEPSNADVVQYMMLCQARQLNPWVGDCVLTGFDSQNGAEFSLIPTFQSVLKRSEINPAFDGMEGGITFTTADGTIDRREGALLLPGEQLVGAWAKCFRKDHAHVHFAEISRTAYDKQRSRWKIDPAGMLLKCAKAAVLREAFPTQLGGLYIAEEMGADEGHSPASALPTSAVSVPVNLPRVSASDLTSPRASTRKSVSRATGNGAGTVSRDADESETVPPSTESYDKIVKVIGNCETGDQLDYVRDEDIPTALKNDLITGEQAGELRGLIEGRRDELSVSSEPDSADADPDPFSDDLPIEGDRSEHPEDSRPVKTVYEGLLDLTRAARDKNEMKVCRSESSKAHNAGDITQDEWKQLRKVADEVQASWATEG